MRSGNPPSASAPSAPRAPAELTQALAALLPGERTVVESLSVFADAAPVTSITRAVGKLGYRISDRAPKNHEILPVLQSLAARGLLSGDGPFTVSEGIAHVATLLAAQEGRLEHLAEVVRELRPARLGPNRPISTWALAVRELRIELYGKRWDAARSSLRSLPRYALGDVCRPFDRAWISDLPADIRSQALAGIVEVSTAELEPAEEAFAMLEAAPVLTDSEHRILVERLVLDGRMDSAEQRLEDHKSIESDVGRAWLALLQGRTKDAIAAYEAALTVHLKRGGRPGELFPDRPGLFFVVALIAEGSPKSLARATVLTDGVKHTKSAAFQKSHAVLSEVLAVLARRAEPEDLLFITSTTDLASRDPIEILLQAAAALWTKVELPPEPRAELEKRRKRAAASGLRWYAAQAADILEGLSGKAKHTGLDIPGVRLATLVSPRERWADSLEALLEIASPKEAAKPAARAASTEPDRRLAWIVRPAKHWISIEPREQTRSKGSWSKGKPVALKRLSEQAKLLGFLTAADLVACAAITSKTIFEYHGRYPREIYSLDSSRALQALAGSPNLLIEVSDGVFEACEVRQAVPRLEVARDGERLALTLEPRPSSDDATATVVVRGPRSLEVVEFAPIHHAIARVLGRKPLDVPNEGEARLRAVLSALSGRIAVHADLLGDARAVGSVPGEPRPCFLLRTLGDGLMVSAHVRPLGAKGPLARPGEGGATLFAQVSGRQTCAMRDLGEEKARFERALTTTPVLAAYRGAGADFVLPDRERALDAFLELRALGKDATIEWPDSQPLQVSDAVDVGALHVAITRDAGSFVASGGLEVPGRKEMALTDLIDYLSASPGRFLELKGDERYVALTAELRSRLDEILGLSERFGRGLRIHPLLAPLVASLLASSRVEADAAWQSQVERLNTSGDEPLVPSTLCGELRPYQLEGFRWLVRLSHWGAGACLADDMGLGKTIQAIALLLHRASEGPGLVVAPTSVVPTWVDEIRRFAPTLRVRTFTGPARAQDLTGLGPFDLLVTSYSLLQIDIDSLATIEFATVVLDEAQVIKNQETKRARAAGRLRAEFRVATTGTPIENRLDDLHSIFAFLNPGLLGSSERFQARFSRPIERSRDGVARDRLRKLVAPFILRRTKTQVLPELPARTEVTLRVPLELEETAIYDVIREEAVATLASGDPGALAGRGRFQLLAAIMRLRQAASNARLVLPDSKAPSAKLAALGEILDDLLPNHHKVLVFSQFVRHLELVKELLDERGVSYQYLDGSTPMAARKIAIDRFQAGQGDVFLISLKAGGFGLNLTAADYVVHMDPWWNPAVEDQASDRAHRIGQTRPVTIYRLVARDTIEDKILELHHRKRELAAGILEGSDLAGSMSEAELLDLIRDPR